MNFNLLFTTLSTLSFFVKFQVNSEARQDFFVFDGVNQSAHLFRDDQILTLYLQQNHDYQLYTSAVRSPNFTFSCNGYLVDGVRMLLQNSTDSIKNVTFQNFSILSPILELVEFDCSVEPVYRLNSINYGYLVVIFLGITLLSKSTEFGRTVYSRFFQNTRNEFINTTEECVDRYLTSDV